MPTAIAASRVAGLSAEVLEEYTREKPMRITIPVTYDGVPPLSDAGRPRRSAERTARQNGQ